MLRQIFMEVSWRIWMVPVELGSPALSVIYNKLINVGEKDFNQTFSYWPNGYITRVSGFGGNKCCRIFLLTFIMH